MANQTTIQLGSLGYLDTDDSFAMPFTLGVAPIQDISKKSGGFSKSVLLPATSTNSKLLGQLFDVNIADSSFNQNIKTQCSVLQRGVPIFNGYLRLQDVTKYSSGQGGVDDIVYYDVSLKDSTGDFYQALDGVAPNSASGAGVTSDMGLLEDFDFSKYNHIYTLSAVTSSSANTWQNVYVYPLYYNSKDTYEISDFKPAIYAKVYWDYIFSACGYTYGWETLSDQLFDKLIIPFNGSNVFIDSSNLSFEVGFSANTIYSSTNGGDVDTDFLNYYLAHQHIDLSYLSNVPIKFNSETPTPLADPNNLYNNSTGKYTSNFNGINNFNLMFDYDFYLHNTFGESIQLLELNLPNPSLQIDFIWRLKKTDINSVVSYSPDAILNTIIYSGSSIPTTFTAGDSLIYSGNTGFHSITINNNIGDIIENDFEVRTTYHETSIEGVTSHTNFLPNWSIKNANYSNYATNYFSDSVPQTLLNEGATVEINSFIPKQIKWKDFIASIVKIFNLYLTPDNDKDNHIIIQTRDDFYDSGITIDWSNKFDISKENSIQFLPDLQSKKLVLSYKQANDIYNTEYSNSTGQNYGQATYTFENQFVQDVQTISPIFEPTPLVETLGSVIGRNVVSSIDSQEPKTGLRLLYYGGWIPSSPQSSGWTYTTTGNTNTTTHFDFYPYAGHYYPDPINPSSDLSFATPDYLFYNQWAVLTNNNLYNQYYKRFISQIETGKLFTGYFRLNEYDILNLDFRNKIFVFDSYWFINRIIDYNANDEIGVTQVELINVDEGVKFKPETITSHPYKSPQDISSTIYNQLAIQNGISNTFGGGNTGVSVAGFGNILQYGLTGSIVAGNNNNLSGSGSAIIGNNNVFHTQGSLTLGNNNSGYSPEDSVIVGDNNTIQSGATNVLILGDYVTASTSNTIYSNNIQLNTINGIQFSAITGPSVTLSAGTNISVTGTTIATTSTPIFTSVNSTTITGGTYYASGSMAATASIGSGTLLGGTCTISTTKVTANSKIFLTLTGIIPVTAGFISVISKSAGTSFVVSSSSPTDTSSFIWWIVEPA